MLTIRFPNGQAVQYNDAAYLKCETNSMTLYTCKDGNWVVTIPYASGAVVEAVRPCRVDFPTISDTQAIERILARSQQIDGYNEKLSELKKLLESFNAKTKCWK